jgi:hypothetical protein
MSLNAGSYDMRFLGFPLGASRACGIDDVLVDVQPCRRPGRGFIFFRFFDEIRRKYCTGFGTSFTSSGSPILRD